MMFRIPSLGMEVSPELAPESFNVAADLYNILRKKAPGKFPGKGNGVAPGLAKRAFAVYGRRRDA
ncbi:MAG TPA: hypothetical protein PLB96_11665 [Syntrophales bacterium]|nr:hypothetical protein [Syntrophales bacterium]